MSGATCVTCGRGFTPPVRRDGSTPAMCEGCWWSGAYLAANMRGVLDTLSATTGLAWNAEHTGGGCFVLVAYLTDDEEGPAVMVAGSDDSLSGLDTVATVEAAAHDDGTCWGVLGLRYWDDDEQESEAADTEGLPLRVAEVIARLRENPAERPADGPPVWPAGWSGEVAS